MEIKLKKLKEQALKEINKIKDSKELEEIKNKYFSRKSGELSKLLKDIKDVADDPRPKLGALANTVRTEVETALEDKMKDMSKSLVSELEKNDLLDTSISIDKYRLGHLHPLTQIQYQLEDMFAAMGFMTLEGPELESDYFNFEALNIPSWHPARDMQDTFYIDADKSSGNPLLLRTQTSSMQVRAMLEYGAPLRVVVPGRCFRNEATDVRHEHTFYQLEGFMVDKNINFTHLKGVLEAIAKALYGDDTKVRFRPKYYPFVEPGVNGEVTCFICGGKGCKLCKNTGWLEIFGAGMIHPNVLKAGKIDPEKYTGFAFGFGLTRLVMLKYNIDDIRLMQSGDLRFLNQF